MLRRDWRNLALAACAPALAVITGCSDSASVPATTPVATTVPLPTIAATTTTIAALGPAALPSTVDPVPVDPAAEQAVKRGVQDFFAAYMGCGQAPSTCHPADFHSVRGTAVGQGTVYFQGMAARGEHFAQDLRGSYIVTQSVAFDDPTAAVAFSCWYDASILLGPPDATDRPAVLNDTIISVREKQSLYFDGTEWKVGEAATVQDLGDGNKCPPPDPAG